MFEFDQYQRTLHARPADPGGVRYEPATDVVEMSYLHWSEHCIECAAPDCYASCDLYRRRPDGNCRRFAYGIYKNRRFRSRRGYGAEVSFKTWGRLKANGNTRLEPIGRLLWKERLIGLGVPVLHRVGTLLCRLTGDDRWRKLAPDFDNRARRWHRRDGSGRRPDCFLIEVFNPQPHPVAVQLMMRIGEDFVDLAADRSVLPPPLIASLQLAPGYSRHQFARPLFAAVTEAGIPFKLTLVPEADDGPTLVFLTLDFVTLATREGSTPAPPPGIKCVVFDLDDTLWHGILLEDRDVRPQDGMVRLIRELDRRGILMSIASKNDPELAMRRLEELNLADFFLHPQINWHPKSENVAAIAGALGLGLDTFAFVDDSPFELAEVAHRWPDVACVPVGEAADLLDRPRFEGSTSAEARQRRRYYRDALARDADRSRHPGDYRAFLAACATRLEIAGYRPADLDRVVELAQRTNQLNFSGTKYARGDIVARLADRRPEKYVLRCSDRYGSYGTVGLALVRRHPRALDVEEFMLSCRVQGRAIEQAFFAFLAQREGENAIDTLRVAFRQTARNGPARRILDELGFRPDRQQGGMVLNVREHPLACDVVEVVATA